MLQCKYQFLWRWGLGAFFGFLSYHQPQYRLGFDLLCSLLLLCLVNHTTYFNYCAGGEALGAKVVIKAVSFMMGSRIITSCTQLLNSSWTFGLAVRKRLEIKTPDLNPFLFPHLFSQPLAWTLCTVQLSLPIWIFAAKGGWIRHRNPTPPSSGRGWNWIPAGGRCSWLWITSLRRSSLHPDSSYHF